jgi:hypothetical protein
MIVRTCTPLASAGQDAYRPSTRFTRASYPGPLPLFVLVEAVLDAEMVGIPIPLDAFLLDENKNQIASSNHFYWNARSGDSTYFSYVWKVAGLQVPAAGEYRLDLHVASEQMRSIWVHCRQGQVESA